MKENNLVEQLGYGNEKIVKILKENKIGSIEELNEKNLTTIMETVDAEVWEDLRNTLESLGITINEKKSLIDELTCLSNKTKTILKNNGITYLEDMNGMNIEDIKGLRGLSKENIEELMEELELLGIPVVNGIITDKGNEWDGEYAVEIIRGGEEGKEKIGENWMDKYKANINPIKPTNPTNFTKDDKDEGR